MTTYTDDEYATLAEAGAARAELRQCEKAFDDVRNGLFKIIEASPIDAAQVREHAYAGLQVLKAVKEALETAAAAGEVVQKNKEVQDILTSGTRGRTA